MERLLTLQDVCDLFQFKPCYVYRLTHENRIPYYKVGNFLRFRKSELEAWLSQHAQHDSCLLVEPEVRYGSS